ncbi:hypothetical protein AMATHDRAFT_5279 [Amanita thiersii Skay4041]|uniref:F-box domain-containing protein n=1 Tax=Amanita thiersii Skay4041 TaxID=703135 RepID=A0A2A9NL81_9AGAR|nr:hypothetical protein AMATHDRAFT_5279 [Amanita thiersii Skay4041]
MQRQMPPNSLLPIDIADIGESNRTYSKISVHIIGHLKDSIEEEVSRLDKVVTNLNLPETATSLRARRDALAKQLDRCNVALAPHKVLPSDVLRYIFLHCIESAGGGGTITFPLRKQKERPIQIILSHVCTLWRHIVLATPTIWTKLTIANFLTTIAIPGLREVLSRVQKAPLSLLIHQSFQYRDGLPLKVTFTTFVNTFYQQIILPRRIRELSLRFRMEYEDQEAMISVLRKVQAILYMPLPDLELLEFRLADKPNQDVEADRSWAVCSTNGGMSNRLPTLTTLRLHGSVQFYACIHDHMCWGQLRSLSITSVTIEWVLGILHQCRLLETFDVDMLLPYRHAHFRQTVELKVLHISLPHLHHLGLSLHMDFITQDLRRFLDPLSIPNLESLSYNVVRLEGGEIWPHAPDPLIEDRLRLGNIEKLELYPPTVSWSLTNWRKARSLRQLHLHYPKFDTQYTLNSSLESIDLFPLLESVNFNLEQDPGTILKMVEKRQRNAADAMRAKGTGAVSLLKKVQFPCVKGDIEPFKDLVTSLRNTGLELDIDTFRWPWLNWFVALMVTKWD